MPGSVLDAIVASGMHSQVAHLQRDAEEGLAQAAG